MAGETLAPLLGTRVSVDGKLATILFAGSVGETSGEWLGVEWDDPARGKHDGTHNGQRYFTPSNPGPTSCSFVRRNKVCFGNDIVEGVKQRYGKVEGETAGVGQQTIDDLQKEIGARFVQVVGFDKVNSEQCQFDKLRSVSLRNRAINDSQVDLAAFLPALVDLDLSENLLSSWTRLADLVCQVGIKVLNLSSNRLPVPGIMPVNKFSNIQHLIIGEMGYSWSEVEEVAGDLPNLVNLQVHKNKISTIQVGEGKFSALRELDLDCNQISDWSSILSLDRMTNLGHLRVNENRLSRIDVTSDSLKNLRILHMSDNCIDSWEHVARLNQLKLTELRFRQNPVLDKDKPDVCRLTTVALVDSLQILNGSMITDNERKWAEIDYYKKHGLEYLKIIKLPDEKDRAAALEKFSKARGRYLDIVEKLGVPEEAELVVKENNLKSTLISIQLRAPQAPEAPQLTKKLPASMTISKLKSLVTRLFRSAGLKEAPRLFLTNSKCPQHEQELDNDLRELSYYSVEDGDSILVKWD